MGSRDLVRPRIHNVTGDPPAAKQLEMGAMTDHDSTMIGSAGEHYVLYELHRRNIHAAQTPAGTKDTDILVVSDGKFGVRLQVKTRTTGPDGGWQLHERHSRIADPLLFYVLVNLELNPPTTYVVPARVVAKAVDASHRAWIAAGGQHRRKAGNHSVRRLRPAHPHDVPGFPDGWMEPYRDAWDSLNVGDATRYRAAPALDAVEVLNALVGQVIHTVDGSPNTVLACDSETVLVGTGKSPNGQPVKVEWVQHTLDLLTRDGLVEISTTQIGFRSAFCGAVAASVPGTIVSLRPAVVRLG